VLTATQVFDGSWNVQPFTAAALQKSLQRIKVPHHAYNPSDHVDSSSGSSSSSHRQQPFQPPSWLSPSGMASFMQSGSISLLCFDDSNEVLHGDPAADLQHSQVGMGPVRVLTHCCVLVFAELAPQSSSQHSATLVTLEQHLVPKVRLLLSKGVILRMDCQVL
jgi:hypothetical protein